MMTTIAFVIWVLARFLKWYYAKKFGILLRGVPFFVLGVDKLCCRLFKLKPTVKSVNDFYNKM